MNNFLGVQLTLLIGPTVAVPAPLLLTEAFQSAEVTHSDEGRSGFQLVFKAGRDAQTGLIDYPLLSLPLLRPFNRVVLIVTFGGVPSVLMDGIITHQQLSPGTKPGTGLLTVTGEDVSVMMDLEEKSAEHPAQDETIIALKLIASYAQYGLIPLVIPPVVIDPPIPIERTPVQQGTDLEYLRQMAARHGYVFFVMPGPAPLTNVAYWGPPKRLDVPQPALSTNLGPATNVDSIDFQYNALEPALVSGQVQDRLTGQTLPVQTFASTRLPLSMQPAWLTQQPNVRTRAFRDSGVNVMQAFGRAQATTDASVDRVLTATGELSALRYGSVLKARGVVGVRGAGLTYSGLYYVKKVTHKLSRGAYKQQFTLVRDGQGSLTPVVVP